MLLPLLLLPLLLLLLLLPDTARAAVVKYTATSRTWPPSPNADASYDVPAGGVTTDDACRTVATSPSTTSCRSCSVWRSMTVKQR